jgi:hypothetical protein
MIESLANLPDFPLLQQLARALWRNGTARGAAVLVGAGFSKHAECAAPDTLKPPLWPELINAMAAQLYRADTTKIPANPLRVAEECVKLVRALGATGLENNTIRDWISDARNDPLPEVRFVIDEINDAERLDD